MDNMALRKTSFNWHRKLIWFALVGLLMFIISAITHPILSWTGPKAAKFRSPTLAIKAEQLSSIASILQQHNIQSAQIVKVVPSKVGNVLQVTEAKHQARRYFDLNDGNELPNFDQQHATWLAQYYVGSTTPIKHIEFITEFDSAYPWVNRLLPVYRIEFADHDNTSAYIYTEINALAGLGNDYKTRLQAVFRALHTWSWLDKFDGARVIILALLLVCILLMCITGIALLCLIRGRKNSPIKTKIHRITAYIVALPLLGFCISGFVHLLHYGFSESHRGMVAAKPLNLTPLHTNTANLKSDFASLPKTPLNHASITEYQGELYYRLSLPSKRSNGSKNANKATNETKNQGEHAHHSRAQRTARFKGQSTEQGGIYIAINKDTKTNLNDTLMANYLASQHLGIKQDKIRSTEMITRFGMHYDFRNKRLPVWQVDFASELDDKVFIDPATGVMVDRLVDHDRYEGYVFSLLHKWNFLTPFTGRFWRDVIVVIMLSLSLLLSLIGLSMRLKRKRQQH